MPVKANSNATKNNIICCECAKNIASLQSCCRKHDRTHMFCYECAQKHIIDLLQISGMHNTICGVIVAFGLILVNKRSVWYGYSPD